MSVALLLLLLWLHGSVIFLVSMFSTYHWLSNGTVAAAQHSSRLFWSLPTSSTKWRQLLLLREGVSSAAAAFTTTRPFILPNCRNRMARRKTRSRYDGIWTCALASPVALAIGQTQRRYSNHGGCCCWCRRRRRLIDWQSLLAQRPPLAFSSSTSNKNDNNLKHASRYKDIGPKGNPNDTNRVLLSSTQSATVKRIQNLLQKRKARLEYGQVVVEGPRLVRDLMRHTATRHLIDTIVVDPDKASDYLQVDDTAAADDDESVMEWRKEKTSPLSSSPSAAAIATIAIKIFYATRQVLQACSDTMTPQGIVAIVRIPRFDLELRITKCNSSCTSTNNNSNASYATDVGESEERSTVQTPQDAGITASRVIPYSGGGMLFLVLDGVSDPGNLGTLLRTAVATGVTAVVLLPGCCDVWNPKAIRSAMTASFVIPTVAMSSWTEAMNFLQHHGVRTIWAATMRTTADDDRVGGGHDIDGLGGQDQQQTSLAHYQVNWCQAPSALVIGGEGAGLSPEIREQLKNSPPMPMETVDAQTDEDEGADCSTNNKSNDDDNDNPCEVTVRAVHLPMCPGIESLNAAICGSVIMFEYLRQQQQHQHHQEGTTVQPRNA